MQIPDVTRASESDLSNRASLQNADASGPPTDSPTVVRSSSSSERRSRSTPASTPPVPVPLPLPGEVIGTFKLEEAIGVGGMGAVFRARDLQLDREVALKLLPPDQAGDPEVVQRFYQEGRAAARLDHENIARVYSIGQDGPHHFIAFEFIEGVTVRRQVDERGPLPINDAVEVTLQIAQALVHAAERGVVHRDIKPSNIILNPQGRAKLVDMGLARRFERETDHGLTQSGMTLGTFDYISPEQARDPRDVDVRSDLYSLGCTLFHMLTGTPPFPGGTVLQKLLQHQEEPPPDLRSLNPQVPAELARIINKLMAKDRDRRYQSPEQLVRDLLSLAGQVGLEVIQPNQHPWPLGGPRLTWEYHQTWFFPALAFVIVVAGLFWWGRELTSSERSDPGLSAVPSPRNENAVGYRPLTAQEKLGSPNSKDAEVETSSPFAPQPRNVVARAGDDLLELIAKAPRKAFITLVEDGAYLIGGRAAGARETSLLLNRDVTIRAEQGTRPVLKFATDARMGDQVRRALLAFSGGTVTIEGLGFELEDADGEVSCVWTEDTDLTLKDCSFRRSSSRGDDQAALRVHVRGTSSESGDRPPGVSAGSCHFDGGQVAIHVEGPADLLLRDCTFGPSSPAIRLANGQAISPVPVEIELRHSSLMARSGPVFQVEGSQARFRVDDCVVAVSSQASSATLVSIDNPRSLSWRGRGNLYSGLRAYLESTRGEEGFPATIDFANWRDASLDVQERGTLAVVEPVWKSPSPLRTLVIDQDDPTPAFDLAARYRGQPAFYGVRKGPHGTRLTDLDSLAQGEPPVQPPDAPSRGTESPEDKALVVASKTSQPSINQTREEPGSRDPAVESPSAVADRPMPAAGDDSASLPAMPPMTTPPADEPVISVDANDARFESSASNPAPRDRADSIQQAAASTRSDSTPRAGPDGNAIRTAEEFTAALGRLGPGGGLLRIAAGADLELPSTEFTRTGERRIEAEPGHARPRIRYRNTQSSNRNPAAWSVLFNLRSGSLRLNGLDLLIQDREQAASRAGRIAAVAVAPGTKLQLDDCTVTVAGQSTSSASIVVQPLGTEPATPGPRDSNEAASVEVTDSFLRSAGDLFHIAPGRQLGIKLRNLVIGSEGSLLHALGYSRDERSKMNLTLSLDRGVALNKGGLVHLESTPTETELPVVEIVAEDSVLSTAGQEPLFRVDGQDSMEGLRDRIVWKAERVAYDQIATYRRDQILRTGNLPRDYSRARWRISFEPKDVSPIVDDMKFLSRLDPAKSAFFLTRDDMRLDPRSPAVDSGPDLERIPDPPAFGL